MKARVYGNQHGTWIEFDEEATHLVMLACDASGATPSEFLDQAINQFIDTIGIREAVDARLSRMQARSA